MPRARDTPRARPAGPASLAGLPSPPSCARSPRRPRQPEPSAARLPSRHAETAAPRPPSPGRPSPPRIARAPPAGGGGMEPAMDVRRVPPEWRPDVSLPSLYRCNQAQSLAAPERTAGVGASRRPPTVPCD
eukprot:1687308-Prymnesium_polylepis.2